MKLKDKVEYCLKKHPTTRNSDIMLMRAIWHEFHNSNVFEHNGRKAVYLEDLLDLPSEDKISRFRRKFNEIGQYLPNDPAVLKARKLNEIAWREEMSPSNPSRG